jgi:uncharacterized membrane protein
MARLRTYFLTGLIVAGPLAITAYLSWWLITLVDGWVKPWIPGAYSPDTYLGYPVPGFGAVAALVAITVIGFLTANLVGRSVIGFGEGLLDRTPFVRGLYKGVKQIFETVFRQDGRSFREVALVEWPAAGLWSLCFVTEAPQGALAAELPPNHVCIFVPCTPNPTTGYLVFVDRARIRPVQVSPDEAFKLVMSLGIIQPSQRPAPPAGAPQALAGAPQTLSGPVSRPG